MSNLSLRAAWQIVAGAGLLLCGITMDAQAASTKPAAAKKAAATAKADFRSWAQRPVMGWNSWDYYATTITEAQADEQMQAMVRLLKPHGWDTFTVDIQWYEPQATGFDYRKGAPLTMDGYGRLLPAPNRFPSAADGAGFKAMAARAHAQGLKFGIHLMRGIPRQAVQQNMPVLGTNVRAADIADTESLCSWNTDMYGVDMSKPGAQAYYDSVFALIASWDVDLVKIDDLSRPYHDAEIEGIRKAIDKTGRAIVLSTSPGETPLARGAHVIANANQWRISDDFWDGWPQLLEQFKRLDDWTLFRAPGGFPDADMLPLGWLRMGKDRTRFTPEEQYTLMSLWSIARSPLILGADMTRLDDFTLSLLVNDEVIAVNQHSTNNRELFRRDDGGIAWVADVPGSKDKYLAVFSTKAKGNVKVPVKLKELGCTPACKVRDLWAGKDLGSVSERFAPELAPHGGRLYRISQP